MRSTQDLIRELAREAGREVTFMALAVAFDDHTMFVFHRPDAERELLQELNEHLRSGGDPIGFIGILQALGKSRFYCRALEEYAGEPWVGGYFERLFDRVRDLFVERGGVIAPDVSHPERN